MIDIITEYKSGIRNFSFANLYGAGLRGADLHGANLRGANLHGADLYGANLHGANLHGANLYGADLRDADLRDADLRGANLYGAKLDGVIDLIQGSMRSDGYIFYFCCGSTNYIKAGCRYFTVDEARDHWTATRLDTPLGRETFAIIDNLIALATIRGML